MTDLRCDVVKPEPIRFLLRRETRPEHDALDNHPAFLALINGTLSLPDYRRLMQKFHDFYSALDPYLENACGRFGASRSGFHYERRTALLAGDLMALGVRGEDLRRPRPSNGRAPVGSAAALAGMLYVFEGSLLGGAVLCAATEKLLAPTGSGGNAYWQWCRTAARPRWAMTCRLIEEIAASDGAEDDMVAAARNSFHQFAAWFDCWDVDAGDPPSC